MKEIKWCLLGGLVLALVTGFIGWLGIRTWDGESGGNLSLLLFGLPMWGTFLALSRWLHSWPLLLGIGFAVQWAVCIVPVALVRLLVSLLRSRRSGT